MKVFLLVVTISLFFVACSTKTPPTRDISNAKMALVKAEGMDAKRYASDDLVAIKVKFQNLQRLMQEERYGEAKFLAQEIQADARLLEKKSQRIRIEAEVKKLQGEINLIKKDFTQIQE
jgi:outer membrane PBP1 activator LpoA protein